MRVASRHRGPRSSLKCLEPLPLVRTLLNLLTYFFDILAETVRRIAPSAGQCQNQNQSQEEEGMNSERALHKRFE